MIVTAAMSSNAALNVAVMSYGVDGNSTQATLDARAVSYGQEVTQSPEPSSSMSAASIVGGMSPGSHTFQVYIRSTRGTSNGTTATFSNMTIIVIPLP